MARKEPENFYRRQQEEVSRIAVKQHRALVDLVRLAKSSNEELRKMRRAFEAFAEAVSDMKIEPFKLQAFTAARAEAERTAKIAEGEHPPPLFDVKALKEALDRGEAPVVPEGEPYPEVQIEPDHSKKRVEARSQRAPRLGFGDVVDSPDERTVPPLVVVDEAEEGSLRWKHKLSDEAAERLEEAMSEGEGDPLPFDRDEMFACPSDCTLDHEHIAAHGSDPAFWHEPDPEEECADVSEARRTPQGYATGGYTGVSDSPFAEPQLAGVVHPGELWGAAKQLQRMRDLGLIAEGVITHETDAQLDMDRSQGQE